MKCNLKSHYFILVSLALSVTFVASQTEAFSQSREVLDWSIEFRGDKSPGTSGIALGESYVLKNLSLGKHVGYGSREYGINLIWDAPLPIDDGNIRFESPGGKGQLMHGQAVAVFVKNGGYLYYATREYGINLKWSKTPVYEWKVQASGPVGGAQPIQLKSRVSLYNAKARDYVVYCKREYGINLRWAKDCK
jgi:hypothetical protein